MTIPIKTLVERAQTLGDTADVRRTAPVESDYRRLWMDIDTRVPAAVAFAGGALADRLSWVFLAAYQGAIRSCFTPPPDNVWSTFAVSEDRTGTFPGVTRHNNQLHGSKSWIAASDNVDELLVTIGPGLKSGCVRVKRDAPGLSLITRPPAAFLGDMSQGNATFAATPVSAADEVDLAGARNFGLAEPFFVLVAASGYLLVEAQRLGDEQLADDIFEICNQLDRLYSVGFANDLVSLQAVYSAGSAAGKRCSSLVAARQDPTFTDWQGNGRLLGMYGRGIRERVQRQQS